MHREISVVRRSTGNAENAKNEVEEIEVAVKAGGVTEIAKTVEDSEECPSPLEFTRKVEVSGAIESSCSVTALATNQKPSFPVERIRSRQLVFCSRT